MTLRLSRRTVLATGAASLAAGLGPSPVSGQEAPHVFMVLPRDQAATERGFRDYFERRGIAICQYCRSIALNEPPCSAGISLPLKMGGEPSVQSPELAWRFVIVPCYERGRPA